MKTVKPERRGPSWTARFTDPKTGRRFRKTIGPAVGPGAISISKARESVARIQIALLERRFGSVRKTMAALLDEWLPLHAKRTDASYHKNVDKVCRDAAAHFGRTAMRDITIAQAEEYALGLLDTRQASTVRQIVSGLVACWNAASERGYVDQNPWPIVRRHRIPRVELKVVYVLTETERKALMNRVAERYRPFVGLIDEMGLRRGEAENLTWNDYRPPRLTVRKNKTKLTKTRKARTMRLTPKAQAILQSVRASGPFQLIGADPIFGVTADMAGKAFKAAIESMDPPLPIRGLHDLRHNVATRAAMGGSNEYQISRLLGNSPQICLRYMDHAPQVGADLAVDALERISGSGQAHLEQSP